MNIIPYFREGHDPGDEDHRQSLRDRKEECAKAYAAIPEEYTWLRPQGLEREARREFARAMDVDPKEVHAKARPLFIAGYSFDRPEQKRVPDRQELDEALANFMEIPYAVIDAIIGPGGRKAVGQLAGRFAGVRRLNEYGQMQVDDHLEAGLTMLDMWQRQRRQMRIPDSEGMFTIGNISEEPMARAEEEVARRESLEGTGARGQGPSDAVIDAILSQHEHTRYEPVRLRFRIFLVLLFIGIFLSILGYILFR